MQCSQCGSEDLKRLELIVEEGSSTQVTEAKGITRGAAGGGSLYASSSVRTTTQKISKLAEKVAPPRKKSPLGSFFIGVVLAPIGAIVIGGLLSFVIDPGPTLGGMIIFLIAILIFVKFVLTAKRAASFNKNEFPAIYNSWKNSFRCGRCGEIFEATI